MISSTLDLTKYDPNKSFVSVITREVIKPEMSELDFGISSNLDLTMSELELRDIHVKDYKSHSDKQDMVRNRSRFPRVLQTRSLLLDELEILKINMSLNDFGESEMLRDRALMKKKKTVKSTLIKKVKLGKKKDLLTVIEGSETAKTDRVIWKFLKRNSILRKEYLNIKKFLIEVQGLYSTDSRLQNTQSVKLTCPNCRFFVITKTEKVSTTRTKIISIILTILGFCNATFMTVTIKDTVHMCPLCHIYLGFCPALGVGYKSAEIRTFVGGQKFEQTKAENTEVQKLLNTTANSKLDKILAVFTDNDKLRELFRINAGNCEMVSASSTSAKNLFAEPKLRLCDRVQVNVNNVAAITRQIQRGSKTSENLISAAKNFALQEAAIENSETNLKKLKLITGHMHNQLDLLCNSSSKMEIVLEQVRSMQR